MKKISVSFQFDDEKLNTLKMYLEDKKMDFNSELEKYVDSLYTKHVPLQVREFIKMKSGEPVTHSTNKGKAARPKDSQKQNASEPKPQNDGIVAKQS